MVHDGTCFREFLSFRIQLFWLWQEQSALKRPGAAKSSKEFKWKAAHFRRLVVVGKRETRQLSPANASCVEKCSVCHRQMGMGQVGDVRDSLPRISLPNMPSTCWLWCSCLLYAMTDQSSFSAPPMPSLRSPAPEGWILSIEISNDSATFQTSMENHAYITSMIYRIYIISKLHLFTCILTWFTS